MNRNRRSFLFAMGGLFSGFAYSSFSKNAVDKPPVSKMTPSDKNHSVEKQGDNYAITHDWFGYSMSYNDRFIFDYTIPIDSIKHNKDNIRTHFEVYENAKNSKRIAEITSEFEDLIRENLDNFISMNLKYNIVPELVNFVQTFEYISDPKNRYAPIEYPQYPEETLYLGKGDCEDTTILLGTMLENLSVVDLRVAIVILPAHTSVLVARPDLPYSESYEKYITIDGVPYVLFESTTSTVIKETPKKGLYDYPLGIYKDGELQIKYENIPEGSIKSIKTYINVLQGEGYTQ